MTHRIKIEKWDDGKMLFYKAYVIGKEDYYSLGNTPKEARGFLEKAIKMRPDIYRGEEV